MKRITVKAVSLTAALLLILCSLPIVSVLAKEFPNTYVNTGNQAADIVGVAVTQNGYCEGSLSGDPALASTNNYQKYGLWYEQAVNGGYTFSRDAWCACFVSWCANQAGIPSSIVPYHAYCPSGVNWFKNKGQWKLAPSRGGSYTPKMGDIIYFAPEGSSSASHVGIVRSVSGGYVYTAEGNTSGQNGEVNEGGGAFLKKYSLSYSRIFGYGVPAYQDNSGHRITFESNGGSSVTAQSVKDGQTVTKPTDPTKYAFTFAGWYCDPELTSPYDFNTPVPYSFTLYAKWDEAYWGANTNLMPIENDLKYNSYNENNDRLFAYWGSNGVDMYSGVDGWAWPSAYMNYMNSVDAANDAYIYVKKDGTAYFNAAITYLDRNGEAHEVYLSELAGNGRTDFEPGYDEFFVNFGQYVADQGHLTDTGNVKITQCLYFVIGEKDQYVKLYDLKFTPAFAIEAPYLSLYGPGEYEQSGTAGCYTYDNGVLHMSGSGEDGYTVTVPVNKSFSPSLFSHLLMDVSSTTDFNITLNLSDQNGEHAVELRREFFNFFDLTEVPAALPAGTWKPDMNILGYFEWNGGVVDSSTVKSITVTVYGKGDLSLAALQTSRSTRITYVEGGQHASGTWDAAVSAPSALTSQNLAVSESIVSHIPVGTSVGQLCQSFDQDASYLAVYDQDGQSVSSGAVSTGMTIAIVDNGNVLRSYVLSVAGDVNGDGAVTTDDARSVLFSLFSGIDPFTPAKHAAADYDNNGVIDTTDARRMLLHICNSPL